MQGSHKLTLIKPIWSSITGTLTALTNNTTQITSLPCYSQHGTANNCAQRLTPSFSPIHALCGLLVTDCQGCVSGQHCQGEGHGCLRPISSLHAKVKASELWAHCELQCASRQKPQTSAGMIQMQTCVCRYSKVRMHDSVCPDVNC